MDPRLLKYYNQELQYLSEMGAEFAQQFPKIAARLGMSGLKVSDPYVERLLEGVGFLAARVQLKLDAEFPRFTQALLEIVHPHYLAPTPSMLVAKCTPSPGNPALVTGARIPRGSTLQAATASDDDTACQFRTAQDVRLWPIEVTGASYFTYAPDLPLNTLPVAQRIKGGFRIQLRTAPGLTFAQIPIDHLPVYLDGSHHVANALYELSLSSGLGVLVLPGQGRATWHELLPADSIRPLGFGDGEALLPVTLRGFRGYRLLQEYFALPQRFRFLDLTGLESAMARVDRPDVELVVLLGRGDPKLESLVDASNVSLFCTPAINLFKKRADRIHVSDAEHEYHVVPDRTRPLDFEVFDVSEVVGYGVGADSEQRFWPFYTAYGADEADERHAYFTVRREPRLRSVEAKRRGSRSSYVGSEVFLSLVDPAQAPFGGDLRQLSLDTLCTNRDLVLQMPRGVDLTLDVAAPVARIRAVDDGPSRPYAPLADGAIAWRAISHLSLNYLSIVDATPEEGASALRDLLELYAPGGDVSTRKQIEGLKSVRTTPVVRRLPAPARRGDPQTRARSTHGLAFGRGIEVTVEVDEMFFEGASAFLLGSVLSHFFSRHVSINSFTETVLRSLTRGDEINRWGPQWGVRPTL